MKNQNTFPETSEQFIKKSWWHGRKLVIGGLSIIAFPFVFFGIASAIEPKAPTSDVILAHLESGYTQAVESSTKAAENLNVAKEEDEKQLFHLCDTWTALKAYKVMTGTPSQDTKPPRCAETTF